MSKTFLVIALIFVSFLLQSCNSLTSQTVETQVSNETLQLIENSNETEADLQISTDGKVDYDGISFQFNPQTWDKVKMNKIIEDQPLREETDKPGEDFPAHPVFNFIQKGEDKGRMVVLPIEKYRQMYAVSKDAVEYFDETLQNLRKAVSDKNFRVKKEIPFLLFWDAGQAIVVKAENITFKNGKSICFISQYEQDEHLINNEMLTYYCQGITSDGKNYFFAEFPVKAPFLHDSLGENEFEGYKVPAYLKDHNEKEYRKYISKITKRLEELPNDKYEPNLKYFEEIISSLEIKQ